ncbi:MAG: response regulator transcription factor [Bacteroidia bacterium]
MKVLIVEDEPTLLDTITTYLAAEGYLCEAASDYISASNKIANHVYDCIVVDITLPNGSGLDLIKELKENRIPSGVIIISAKNSLDDKLKGLQLGSDDYLTKPFHLPELNARIQAIMRRKNFDGSNIITCNEIKIDTVAKYVSVNEKEVTLTLKEYDLLVYFLANKNRVLSKSAIVEHLWQDNIDQSDSYNFLYTHIKNLRKKLIDHGSADYINTIYGMGYNFKTQ